MRLMSRKKEKGLIGMSFGIALKAVTLWKIGPFRKVLYRDIDGRCHTDFAWMEWWVRTV